MRLLISICILCFGAHTAPGQGIQSFTLPNLADHDAAIAIWADFDADGQPDFFISGVTQDVPIAANAQLFFNNGDSTFTPITGFTAVYDGDVAVADYNYDGFPDMVVMGTDINGDPVTEVYLNNGDRTFTQQSWGLAVLEQGFVAWWDADHDGDLDLLQSGRDASGTVMVKLWTYDSGSYTEQTTNLPALAAGDVAIADFNGDQRTDLLLTGSEDGLGEQTVLYLNTLNYEFAAQTTGLPPLSSGQLALADYNGDGAVDVALAGLDTAGLTVAQVYSNDGTGFFTDSGAGLDSLALGAMAWVDLDNDGAHDLLLTGTDTSGTLGGHIYRYTGTFTELTDTLVPMMNGALAWADFNGDGDADLLQSGLSAGSRFSQLYHNAALTANAPPAAPTGLTALASEDSVMLRWVAPTDDYTAAASLTYAVYLSTDPDSVTLMNPQADLSTGARRIGGPGNAGWDTAYALYGLAEGKYYWAVQALDAAGQASPFAAQDSVSLCYGVALGNDTAACQGDTLTFALQSTGNTVNWYTTQLGLLQSDSYTAALTVTQNDTLVVEVVKPWGCTVYDTLRVERYALPSFSIGDSLAACDGEVLTLETTPAGWADVDWYSFSDGAVAADTSTYNRRIYYSDTVYAIATDSNGCANTDSVYLNWLALPSPSVGADDSACVGDTLVLSVSPTGWDSVRWYSFRYDSMVSTLETPAWAVAQTDTLRVAVTDANGCQNTDTLRVVARALPSPSLGADTIGCRGDTLVLSLALNTYDSTWWYYESTDSLMAQQVYTWNHPLQTTDTLLVRVQDAYGCEASTQLVAEVNALPAFTLGADTAGCLGDSLVLQPSPAAWANVDWYDALTRDTLAAAAVTYALLLGEAATYVAHVTDINGCQNTDTVGVGVYALPVPITPTDTTLCEGDSLTLSVSPNSYPTMAWTWLDRDSVVSTTASLTWAATGTDTLVVAVTDANGCTASDSTVVSTYALPTVSIGDSVGQCVGELLTLSTVPGGWANVVWYDSTTDTVLQAGGDAYTWQMTEDVRYYAVVTDGNGCSASDTVAATAVALPAVELGPDTTGCRGSEITLNVGNTYARVDWYTTEGDTLSEDAFFLTLTLDTAFSLVVVVQSDAGCVQSDTLGIAVRDNPVVALADTVAGCTGDTLRATVSPGGWAAVQWTTADISVTADTLVWPAGAGTWQVLVTDNNGCQTADSLRLQAWALPAITLLTPDTALCLGDSLDIGITLPAGYTADWYAADTLYAADTAAFRVAAYTPTTWQVFVSDSLGCISDTSLTVGVYALPTPLLAPDTTLCAGPEITLTVAGGAGSAFLWTDTLTGDTLSTAFFYTYAPADTLTLRVRETDGNGCQATDVQTVYVNPSPTVVLSPDSVAACVGDTLRLTTADTWSGIAWTTARGDTATSADFALVMPAADPFQIRLTVADANGCGATDVLMAYPLALPAVDLGLDTAGCVGDTLDFGSGIANAQYAWWDTALGDRLGEDSAYAVAVATDLALALVVTDAYGCTEADTVSVTAYALPTVDLGADITECDGETLALGVPEGWALVEWFTPGMDSALTRADTVFVTLAGEDVDYQVQVTSAQGCVNRDTLSIAAQVLPVADAGADQVLCEGLGVALGTTDLDSYSYAWLPATGLDAANAALPLATPTVSTQYILTVTDGLGCQATDTVQVLLDPRIAVDAGRDTAICFGSAVLIGGQPTALGGGDTDYTYTWSPATHLDADTLSNPVATPTDTITYTVVAQVGNCPAASDQVTVAVIPLPVPLTQPDTTLGYGHAITLTASGGTVYAWRPQAWIATGAAEATMTSLPLTEEVTFTVVATDAYGCAGTGSVTVGVRSQLFIPELFSPNQDGTNDQLRVLGDGIGTIEFAVYDRRGTVLYFANTIAEATQTGWDGTVGGQPAPIGDYFWAIQGTFADGTPLTIDGSTSGRIRLIR